MLKEFDITELMVNYNTRTQMDLDKLDNKDHCLLLRMYGDGKRFLQPVWYSCGSCKNCKRDSRDSRYV